MQLTRTIATLVFLPWAFFQNVALADNYYVAPSNDPSQLCEPGYKLVTETKEIPKHLLPKGPRPPSPRGRKKILGASQHAALDAYGIFLNSQNVECEPSTVLPHLSSSSSSENELKEPAPDLNGKRRVPCGADVWNAFQDYEKCQTMRQTLLGSSQGEDNPVPFLLYVHDHPEVIIPWSLSGKAAAQPSCTKLQINEGFQPIRSLQSSLAAPLNQLSGSSSSSSSSSSPSSSGATSSSKPRFLPSIPVRGSVSSLEDEISSPALPAFNVKTWDRFEGTNEAEKITDFLGVVGAHFGFGTTRSGPTQSLILNTKRKDDDPLSYGLNLFRVEKYSCINNADPRDIKIRMIGSFRNSTSNLPPIRLNLIALAKGMIRTGRGISAVEPCKKAECVDSTVVVHKRGSPLCHLATAGDSKGIQILLDQYKDIDPNVGCIDGASPIFIAAEKGHAEVVKTLLGQKSIIPNVPHSPHGVAPLFAAALNGHTEVVKALLEHKSVNPNVPRLSDGITPLLIAAQAGHAEVVKELLRHPNINPNLSSSLDGVTPLLIAAQTGHTEVVKELLRHPNINPNLSSSLDGVTPLLIATRLGHAEIVDALLSHKSINPNLAGSSGVVPVILASKYNNLLIVKNFLNNSKVDITRTKKDGSNVLHVAVWAADFEVLEEFLKYDSVIPLIAQKNEYEDTPLHVAFEVEMVQPKVEPKAQPYQRITLLAEKNPNAIILKNKKGYHILHMAAILGKWSLVRNLIKIVKRAKIPVKDRLALFSALSQDEKLMKLVRKDPVANRLLETPLKMR